jgi:hypothetical protein
MEVAITMTALTRMRSRDEGGTDRSFRSLRKLQRTGSSSRVLNLLAISERLESLGGPPETPFFSSPVLGRSIIIKHRLRPDETFLFDDARINATKVIIPFERRDLGLGAQSVFVGQRGWIDQLRVACDGASGFANDVVLLQVIDELPSLDPFLLREYLRGRGHWPGPSYFSIAQPDIEKMQAYVSDEIVVLIKLAFEKGADMGGHTARLVSAILSSELDERLDPLRKTLMLDGDEFREGVFSWKGFLYYKWMMHSLWPQLTAVIAEVGALSTAGSRDADLNDYVLRAKVRLRQAINFHCQRVVETLKVYDDAFHDMTANGRPQAFRDFLLKAPSMFLGLGENVGVVSHIASYWRYRFPQGKKVDAPLDEVANILQEFEISLGVTA